MNDEPVDLQHAPPIGGSASIGVAAGLGVASLAASVWSKIEQDTWNFNLADRSTRIKMSIVFMGAAVTGALIGARRGTSGAALVGASLGVLASQLPMIWDTELVSAHPIAGNLWQFGVPIATTVLAVNAANPTP